MTTLRKAAENAWIARKLVWSPEAKPNDYCSYNHTFADTPIGRYQIEWKGWKDSPSFSIDLGNESVQCWASDIAGARLIAQAHFGAAILSAINPSFLSELDTARKEVERLRGLVGDVHRVLCGTRDAPSHTVGADIEWCIDHCRTARILSPDTTEGGPDRD